MPRSRMSFDHFAWSSRMKAANCAGVLPEGSAPSATILCLSSSSASTAFASAESLSTTAFGVAAGASSPNQPIDS